MIHQITTRTTIQTIISKYTLTFNIHYRKHKYINWDNNNTKYCHLLCGKHTCCYHITKNSVYKNTHVRIQVSDDYNCIYSIVYSYHRPSITIYCMFDIVTIDYRHWTRSCWTKLKQTRSFRAKDNNAKRHSICSQCTKYFDTTEKHERFISITRS